MKDIYFPHASVEVTRNTIEVRVGPYGMLLFNGKVSGNLLEHAQSIKRLKENPAKVVVLVEDSPHDNK